MKFNIGILSLNPKVESFSRYGAVVAADFLAWKGLFVGPQLAAKWGALKTKADAADLVKVDGNQPLRSYSAQILAGWSFLPSPVESKNEKGKKPASGGVETKKGVPKQNLAPVPNLKRPGKK